MDQGYRTQCDSDGGSTMNPWTTSSRICLRDNDRPLHNGETSFCSYNVQWPLMNGHVLVYTRTYTHTRDVKTRVLYLKIVRGVSR